MDEFLTEQVTELPLDRSDWQLVKFGDIAIQQKESVDRENTDLTRYVKGEHMGSEDLHLREWGELTDEYLGPAFIRKFEQGDILYGSRRTYLRKVAVAHFDGITSNTTFVIKANQTRVDKRLLPFVLLSEGFAEHSIRNSKGSVNPYINWKDIANYEFLLPPKDQQAKLAELLWAMDEVVEKSKSMVECLENYRDSIANRIFSKNANDYLVDLPFIIDPSRLKEFFLETVCDLITDGAHASPRSADSGMPMATVENMRNSLIDVDSCRTISPEDFYSLVQNNCQPQIGDVLFSKDGTIGKTFVFNQNQRMVLLSSIAIIRTKKNELDPEYCSLMMRSPVFFSEIEKRKSGTALKRVVLKDIKKFKILLPEINSQKKVSAFICNLNKRIEELTVYILNSKSLQKSLINHIC
ncbi:MAG: restriction endonuclease subunit S [Nitrosomonas sp.]